jgi:glucosamine--fructose-6-phosphate aminotransferase (isomerizing)
MVPQSGGCRVGRVVRPVERVPAYAAGMDVIDFDPTAPLPGPPDPWSGTDTPSHRDGPPFHMTDMIAAEPWIAERIVAAGAVPGSGAAALADAVRAALDAARPVVVTGCGTSEHGALAVTEILREATGASDISSAQAFELSLDPPRDGLVIGISHEGGTTATNAALRAARDAGAATALITVTRRSPGGALADVVVETHELDTSWCHTVGYLSPIAAAVAVAGVLTGMPVDAVQVRELVAAGTAAEPASRALEIAGALAGVDRLLVIASGADRVAGREVTLKVEEGAWLPAAYRDLETFLHGHLAATGPTTGLLAVATDRRAAADRSDRLAGALRAARTLGMPAAAIVSTAIDAAVPRELTSAGRIVIPDAPDAVPAAIAALLSSATPLQTLTERLARARGTDPDPIHRDVDVYREAADAAG